MDWYQILLILFFILLFIMGFKKIYKFFTEDFYRVVTKKILHPGIVLFVGGVIGTGFIIYFIQKRSDVDHSILVYWLTFTALIWYAWETQRSKEEQIESNKNQGAAIQLSINPVLDLYFKNHKKEILYDAKGYTSTFEPEVAPERNIFRLRNTGKGQAYNIEIKHDEIKYDNINYHLNHNRANAFLAPNGDELTIEIFKDGYSVPCYNLSPYRKSYNNPNEKKEDYAVQFFNKISIDNFISVIIKCRDISFNHKREGNNYYHYFIYGIYVQNDMIKIFFAGKGEMKDEEKKIDLNYARELISKELKTNL